MYTHITLLIDESGSMSHLRTSVLESIQNLISKQQEIKEPCTITISTFDGTTIFGWESPDTRSAIIRTPIRMGDIQTAKFESYNPNGSTPLLEALCREIDNTGDDLVKLPVSLRPEKVIFLIMTDGEENSSSIGYTLNAVKNRIEHQTNVYKWEFLFLGANIDAFSIGHSYGIAAQSISTYNTTSAGYAATTQTLSKKFIEVRSGLSQTSAFTKQEQEYLNTTK